MSYQQSLELSFRDKIAPVETENGGIVLRGGPADIPLQQLPPGGLDALRALASGGMTEQDLSALVMMRGGPGAMMFFAQLLKRLANSGLICQTLKLGDQALATWVPQTGRARVQPTLPNPDQRLQLSRFAYVHVEAGQMVLESPLGFAKLILSAQATALIGALAQPLTFGELAASAGLPEPVAAAFMALLGSMEALASPGTTGTSVEETEAPLALWEFHDLLFHVRTRLGRHRNPYGGTAPWHDKIAPLPPIKPVVAEERVALYKPDLDHLKQHDRPLAAVMEARASVRDYDSEPMTAEALGEFLYRCARVKQIYHPGEGEISVSFRPYPAGGALYELEIYALVDQCPGIASGLYHYDPQEHQLARIAAPQQLLDTLIMHAWNTANRQSRPQVSLHITARFQRIQWKYQSIAYSLILKHVGALYQTMYLVATALDLAPCALGGGDADLFATAAGLDYYAETTVGEFVLGSRKRVTDDER